MVSIGPILAVPGLRDALRRAPAPVVGFAGILGGAPVLGMAHRLLPAIGVEVDAAAVGLHYGARARGGVLDVWAMDTADAASAERVQQAGLRAVVTDLIMRTREHRRVRQLRDQVRHVMIAGAERTIRAIGASVITIFAPAGIGEVEARH